MPIPSLVRHSAILALAAIVAGASPAFAQKSAAEPGSSPLSGASSGGAQATSTSAMTTTLYNFDVAAIFSFDGFGDPQNERGQINVGAGARVTGIGWNVTLFADSPSWLEEMAVGFFDGNGDFVLQLRPGVGDDFPGTASYSSGGIIDLIGLGLDFSVGANGLLNFEFFETFDDFANDWDGRWERGALTIQTTTTAVPEPTTLGMMALGLLMIAARRQRSA